MSNSGVTSENSALLYVSITSDLDAAVKPPGMVIQLSVQSDPTPGPAFVAFPASVTSAAVQVLVLIIKASVVSDSPSTQCRMFLLLALHRWHSSGPEA